MEIMSNQLLTHKLYRPLQVAIRPGDYSEIFYREYSPAQSLKSYIYCYYMVQTKILSKPYLYRIMADGCVDLFLNCSNDEPLTLAGLVDKVNYIPINEDAEYFGIRFFPGCIHYFFQVSAKEIANQAIPCHDIFGNRFKSIEDRLRSTDSIENRIEIVNKTLLDLLETCKRDPDHLLLNALDIIYKKKGQLSIEKDVATGISSRHFRRIFDQYIGISPKKF
ncbi:MAG: AraC family transcriptional regulator, partial [Bacteroidetes bacterium]|nr:AraC family transcriptional regulator [Bacteroidota bacterium]